MECRIYLSLRSKVGASQAFIGKFDIVHNMYVLLIFIGRGRDETCQF